MIIPLSNPAEHSEWFEIAIGAMLKVDADPAQARSQQGFYAPNILNDSAVYESINKTDRPFVDISDTHHPFISDCFNAFQKDEARKEREAVNATYKPRVNNNSNGTIIEKVNQSFSLSDVLTGHGYLKKGKKYLSPYSESGMPGVSILNGDRCYSHHGAGDPLSNLNNSGHSLDVFDVLCVLDYGGDVTRAVKELAVMVDAEGQKDRQREYMQEKALLGMGNVIPPGSTPEDQTVFDMTVFSMKGRSWEMEEKMLDDKFALGQMAIQGQSTIFYAPPNAGKTLMAMYLTKEGIKSGEINGEDVFYINADDTYKGLVYKLKIAEEFSFHMLAPGHGKSGGPVFKSDDLPIYLQKMIEQNTASGKILILDTAKKFIDLMSKDKCSKFGEIIRQFISHGGTVIMLAHVNKHRDENKKVIYSGTADLVDDADCAYTLDIIQDDADGMRTIKFENFKSRGDVVLEAFYKYNYAQGTPYYERLDSITPVDTDERNQTLQQQRLNQVLAKNQIAVDAIIECIQEGINSKTALIREASSRAGISKPKIRKVLTEHTGPEKSQNQFWFIKVGDKNAHTYHLNYGVS